MKKFLKLSLMSLSLVSVAFLNTSFADSWGGFFNGTNNGVRIAFAMTTDHNTKQPDFTKFCFVSTTTKNDSISTNSGGNCRGNLGYQLTIPAAGPIPGATVNVLFDGCISPTPNDKLNCVNASSLYFLKWKDHDGLSCYCVIKQEMGNSARPSRCDKCDSTPVPTPPDDNS